MLKKFYGLIKKINNRKVSNLDLVCPVCGYYCFGNGGNSCIDKSTLIMEEARWKEKK